MADLHGEGLAEPVSEKKVKPVLQVEQAYLDQRGRIFSGLGEKKEADQAKAMKQAAEALRLLQKRTIVELQSVTVDDRQKSHLDFVREMVAKDDIGKALPFALDAYLPFHVFETYNTFSVPVERRKLVTLEFKKDGWQYTDGKRGAYQYRMVTPTSFRRTRPLKGGGVGTDVIEYNPLKNRFEKKGGLFMWMRPGAKC